MRTALALLVFALLGASACKTEHPHVSPRETFGELSTLAFAGDTVLARRMNDFVQEEGASRPLQGVAEVFERADLSVVNLECILSSKGEPADKGERNPYYFRGRPELVKVLTSANVDVASLANNHGGDYGPEAVVDGLAILRGAGVDPLGAGENLDEAMAPVFRQVGDVVIGLIGMDMTMRASAATAERAGLNFVSERDPSEVVSRVRDQVRAARRYAHLVFLVTHWGPNGTEEPGDAHRDLARRLVREAGIDGILGSSAHQLHGMESIEGRPIIYDAGNLLFDYGSRDWTHKTAIFVLHFDREGVKWVEAIPVKMHSNFSRLATGGDAEEISTRLEDLSKRLGSKLWLEDGRAMLGLWDRPRMRDPREQYKAPSSSKRAIPTLSSYMPKRVVVDKLPSSATAKNVQFEEGFELIGYKMPAKSKRRHGVRITTYWKTTQKARSNYQIFIHVDPEKRGRPWRGNHQPGDWMYPTNRWSPNQIVQDIFQIRPPGDSARGGHDVFLGLYRGQRRLKVLDPSHHDGNHRVRIASIDVE